MASGNPLEIFELLSSYRIPYLIIGGHAVNYYGYIRATEDCDIIFLRNKESEKLLFDALKEINACWISNEIDPETKLERLIAVDEEFLKNNHLMMLHTDLGYLDIFDYIPGFQEHPVVDLFKNINSFSKMNFISLEWLKKMEKTSGRPRDIDDLYNL